MPTSVLYQLDRLRCRFLPAFALALAFALSANSSWAAPIKFNIPAQATADALILFSKQSSMDVLFAYAELKQVKSVAVQGSFEPNDALVMLLQGTGYTSTRDSGKFVVAKAKSEALAGALRGLLERPDGRPASGVQVSVRGTAFVTTTDERGQFYFALLPAGVCVVVARAEGFQPLHIVDVAVPAGGELSLNKEVLRTGDEVAKLDPYVVKGDPVTELDRYSVYGERVKPFEGANVDIPRTVNDVQPYTIFDAATLARSGADSVENFLKERLTMNTVALTNGQNIGQTTGNLSSINLRGLDDDKTLILVNGRRLPDVSIGTNTYQPDVNGIPLASIDRIEVLPSSASGIYGGSAIGGVVNIILKRDYAGGQLTLNYDNAFDTDVAHRRLSFNYGWAMEGGKTHVMVSASRADSTAMVLQDRRDDYTKNQQTILENSPDYYYSTTNPWLGALPNIAPYSSSVASLTLRDGTSLNSRNTHIAAGTSTTTSATDLNASLLANAGTWNFDLPAGTQSETSLLRPFGSTPEITSYSASIRRQMLPALEAFADFNYGENHSISLYNPFSASFRVTAAAPTNPFKTDVNVRLPDARISANNSTSTNQGFTVGLVAHLPHEWTVEFDYTASDNHYDYQFASTDSTAITAALLSGAINPFVDTLLYPLDLDPYMATVTYHGSTQLQDFALRGSGPLPALPWGVPTLTAGLERRSSDGKNRVYQFDYPISTDRSYYQEFYPSRSDTDSAYGELAVPLVKQDWVPGIHALELQLAGRIEQFVVNSGTPYTQVYYNRNPVVTAYGAPVRDEEPYFDRARYDSTNYTVGFKYEPVADLTLRASQATAFLPPTPAQLAPSSEPSSFHPTVTDPLTGARVAVELISGGNPDLIPQHSKSTNLGAIWTPRWKPLEGLRLNVEYYKIEQFDYIGTLSYQSILDAESTYPDQVVRDADGTITAIKAIYLNLYHRVTEGWDLSADYSRQTDLGAFDFRASASHTVHLKTQYTKTDPEYDAAGYSPAEGGGPKTKGNASFTWERHGWSAGWTARFIDSYKQYGTPGSPKITTTTNALLRLIAGRVATAQGSDTISSQLYHDLFVGYSFGKRRGDSNTRLQGTQAALLSDLTMQFGVRNVFGKEPPFDAYYSSTYYFSPFGDARLRSYWLTMKKAF